MRTPPKRRRRWSLLAAIAAASALAVPLAISSSHREAPNIMLDPAADNTDVYAFTAPGAEDAITIVSDWIPGQVPANGPNFFRFDDRARYYNNVDNNGDGVADIKFRFTFDTKIRNPNSFLYAGPGTQDFNDPKLNVIQTYDLTREEYGKKGQLTDTDRLVNNVPVAPPNIGPKTFPNYDNFVAQRRGRSTTERSCSSARATIRSSSISEPRSTRSTSAWAPATRAPAVTTCPATRPRRR